MTTRYTHYFVDLGLDWVVVLAKSPYGAVIQAAKQRPIFMPFIGLKMNRKWSRDPKRPNLAPVYSAHYHTTTFKGSTIRVFRQHNTAFPGHYPSTSSGSQSSLL